MGVDNSEFNKPVGDKTKEEIDAEYGIVDVLNDTVKKEDVASGKLAHDVRHLDIDLDCLTSGDIDWEKVVGSMQWMIDKTKDALEDHKEDLGNVSQFLAKTAIMHMIQCFHHCRKDAAPGSARAGECYQNQQPSEKESHMKCDTDDHSSPPSPST